MHESVEARRQSRTGAQELVEPDSLLIPSLLSSIADQVIEAKQRLTGRSAAEIRADLRADCIDAVRDVVERWQREVMG